MNFITDRIKEKSSQGGLGLIAVGLVKEKKNELHNR